MLTLIDGNSLLFRAYYGVHSHLTRSDGTPTGAVYGFLNMLLPILASANKDDMFVCVFDASRQTFRQEIFPDYKQNRTETPADLITQSQIVQQCLNTSGIPVLCVAGVEADDVIATLAKQYCKTKINVRIITSDKDLMQLVSDCVYLYDGMKNREIRTPEVIEKFGVLPEQVVDAQSLIGDSSDNVPGVPGIGPKKAAELLNEFQTLDNLYNNLGLIKNERVRNLLLNNREIAYISKKLVQLRDDVDLSCLKISPFVFDKENAIKFVKQYIESNTLIAKIEKLFPDNSSQLKANFFEFPNNACEILDSPSATEPQIRQININAKTITTLDALDNFLANVKGVLAIDTETTGLNQLSDKIVGISLATDTENGVYIPLRHRSNNTELFSETLSAPQQLEIQKVYEKLWPILTNTNIIKVGHNLKYDFHIMENEGWDTTKIMPFDDTMLLSYVLYGAQHGHGLDELAQKYLGHKNIAFSSLFPPKTKNNDMYFDTLSIEVATPYAAEDACICLALYNKFHAELLNNEKIKSLYETCDLPLMPVLMKIEKNGVLVDKRKLQYLSNVFHQQIQMLSQEIWQLAGHEFNIASPKQLGAVLFDELMLPANKKRSTDADTMNELIEAHPIIEKILNWRSIAKLAGTYADTLPQQIDIDGRIHTTYVQTSTNTGRLSSRDPNLQNIPVKSQLGEEIRKCFVAAPDHMLISVDYSQIQLRLLADIANIQVFKDTFLRGQDIHIQTARKIFNIPENQPVPPQMRRAAKTVNFSIIYGISSFGLANQLGVSRTEAQNIINSYMDGLPEIHDYIENTKKFVLQNGFVNTPWGRKIGLPEALNPRTKSYALRAAINAPIQGFEADLMRYAMIEIDKNLIQKNKNDIRMIMQVHDEIVFECISDKADFFARQIKNTMEQIVKLSVPLVAEYTINPVWGK